MSSPIEVIINAAAGPGENDEMRRTIVDLFDKSGISARVRMAHNGANLSALASDAVKSDSEIIVAGGGDGTVSAIAGELVGTDKILGVLPLGTLNHFATDLKLPLEIEDAVKVIVAGHTTTVDVGEVNGRIFINNSSLGLYPDVVRGRERRQRLGHGKWGSLIRSALKVFHRHPLLAVKIDLKDEELFMRTPFIFVGNNEYEMEGFSIGRRAQVDGGKLSLYMTTRTGRLALLTLALRAFFGKLGQEKDFLALSTEDVLIQTRRKQLRVAMDGEVVMMTTPFRYRIRPGELRVLVPVETIAEK